MMVLIYLSFFLVYLSILAPTHKKSQILIIARIQQFSSVIYCNRKCLMFSLGLKYSRFQLSFMTILHGWDMPNNLGSTPITCNSKRFHHCCHFELSQYMPKFLKAHIVISKTILYKNHSEFKCSMCLWIYENLNSKWNCVSIQQAIITLINLLEHKMDMISYKSCTMANDTCIGIGLYLV